MTILLKIQLRRGKCFVISHNPPLLRIAINYGHKPCKFDIQPSWISRASFQLFIGSSISAGKISNEGDIYQSCQLPISNNANLHLPEMLHCISGSVGLQINFLLICIKSAGWIVYYHRGHIALKHRSYWNITMSEFHLAIILYMLLFILKAADRQQCRISEMPEHL